VVRPSQDWRTRIGIDAFLREFPEFSLRPSGRKGLRLLGAFSRVLSADGLPDVQTAFNLEIIIPFGFPATVPLAYERSGRIPDSYHKFRDGSLCLGSTLRLLMAFRQTPTVLAYAREFLVPYLYRFSYAEEYGRSPWPDLEHGEEGLLEDYSKLLGSPTPQMCAEFISLLGLKKRVANKRPCPCGSRLRLGKCHNHLLNRIRGLGTRSSFRFVHAELVELGTASPRRAPAESIPGVRCYDEDVRAPRNLHCYRTE